MVLLALKGSKMLLMCTICKLYPIVSVCLLLSEYILFASIVLVVSKSNFCHISQMKALLTVHPLSITFYSGSKAGLLDK